MIFLGDIWITFRDFMETGGDVLFLILIATLVLWTLIIERYWYLSKIFPSVVTKAISDWNDRSDKTSWAAHRIREKLVSEVSNKLSAPMPFIKTLVGICPLFGLLGTVTGMIAVFEVMAITGTSNARLMASGISMATIPTMAGMVASLSGLFFSTRLEQRAKMEEEKLAENLQFN